MPILSKISKRHSTSLVKQKVILDTSLSIVATSGQYNGFIQEGGLQGKKFDSWKSLDPLRGDLQQYDFRHDYFGTQRQARFQHLISMFVVDITCDPGCFKYVLVSWWSYRGKSASRSPSERTS